MALSTEDVLPHHVDRRVESTPEVLNEHHAARPGPAPRASGGINGWMAASEWIRSVPNRGPAPDERDRHRGEESGPAAAIGRASSRTRMWPGRAGSPASSAERSSLSCTGSSSSSPASRTGSWGASLLPSAVRAPRHRCGKSRRPPSPRGTSRSARSSSSHRSGGLAARPDRPPSQAHCLPPDPPVAPGRGLGAGARRFRSGRQARRDGDSAERTTSRAGRLGSRSRARPPST